MMRVEVAALLGTALGESPVWDAKAGALHLVDIFAHRIHTFHPATGVTSAIVTQAPPGALAPLEGGGWIAGLGLDYATVAPDGATRPIARAAKGERANDGKCDARGRFLSGTMDMRGEPGRAALYSLDVDGSLVELIDGLTLSNGLDWSPDGDRFYHVDTVTERIDVWDYDLDAGRIANRRPFADLTATPGRPDGITVDADGGVWVAVARAGLVQRFDARGRLDTVIELPTPTVTSCTFGGPELRDLYITSARALLPEPLREEDPCGGALFVVEGLGVRGRAPHAYRGTGASPCA